MAKLRLTQATIKFNVNDKPHCFDVATNILDFDLDIVNAVHSWLYRTKEYTAESFCEYVQSKDSAHICIPFIEDKNE